MNNNAYIIGLINTSLEHNECTTKAYILQIYNATKLCFKCVNLNLWLFFVTNCYNMIEKVFHLRTGFDYDPSEPPHGVLAYEMSTDSRLIPVLYK